jgi:hypothetical protein
MAGEKHFMDHADESPDQVASTVFWIIVAGSLAFIAGIIILIR